MKKLGVLLVVFALFCSGLFAKGTVSKEGFGMHATEGSLHFSSCYNSLFFITNSIDASAGYKYVINDWIGVEGGLKLVAAAGNIFGKDSFQIVPTATFWLKEFFITYGLPLVLSGGEFAICPCDLRLGWNPKFWNWGPGVGGLMIGFEITCVGIAQDFWKNSKDDLKALAWPAFFIGASFDLGI